MKYRLIATHRIINFRVLDLKKFAPTIYKPVNIFEPIDVESSEFGGTYSQTREVAIVGEHRKSNIIVKLPKRAAVKGGPKKNASLYFVFETNHFGKMI